MLAACALTRNEPQKQQAYVVFFQDNSTAISRQAAFIINSAVVDANHHTMKIVEVSGPATKATRHYNPGLAEPRIIAVEHALAAAGVDENRIIRISLPPPSTKMKTDSTGAQRVEIRILDKPNS
jgi:hypothetical protein